MEQLNANKNSNKDEYNDQSLDFYWKFQAIDMFREEELMKIHCSILSFNYSLYNFQDVYRYPLSFVSYANFVAMLTEVGRDLEDGTANPQCRVIELELWVRCSSTLVMETQLT